MKHIILFGLILFYSVGYANTCVYMNKVIPQAEIPHEFLALDKDLDCNLTRIEAMPDSELHDSFSSYDVNNDGLLSYDEVYEYFAPTVDSMKHSTPMEDLDDLTENN